MHTGLKIKKVRQLKGYTQDDLAAKINKTRALISHIEQTGKINHYTLLSILKFFGMTEDELERFDGISLIAKESKTKYFDKNEISKLKQRLDSYQKENETLKELVVSQKKVIAMLEKKK